MNAVVTYVQDSDKDKEWREALHCSFSMYRDMCDLDLWLGYL